MGIGNTIVISAQTKQELTSWFVLLSSATVAMAPITPESKESRKPQ